MGEKFSLPAKRENFDIKAEANDHTQRVAIVPHFIYFLITLASVFSPTTSYYNREWANSLLRYAIKVSRGGGFNSPAGVRLSCLIRLHDSLLDHGYGWQGKILNFWIHRFQKAHKTELQALQGLTTKPIKKGGVSKKDKYQDVLVWYPNLPSGLGGEL